METESGKKAKERRKKSVDDDLLMVLNGQVIAFLYQNLRLEKNPPLK